MELSINKNMHPNELIQMHFALGKAYESNNQFEKSFNHYREGNWLQRKQIKYNACLLYTSPSPRDATLSRMPSSA